MVTKKNTCVKCKRDVIKNKLKFSFDGGLYGGILCNECSKENNNDRE